jgi:hypothetical protein
MWSWLGVDVFARCHPSAGYELSAGMYLEMFFRLDLLFLCGTYVGSLSHSSSGDGPLWVLNEFESWEICPAKVFCNE